MERPGSNYTGTACRPVAYNQGGRYIFMRGSHHEVPCYALSVKNSELNSGCAILPDTSMGLHRRDFCVYPAGEREAPCTCSIRFR